MATGRATQRKEDGEEGRASRGAAAGWEASAFSLPKPWANKKTRNHTEGCTCAPSHWVLVMEPPLGCASGIGVVGSRPAGWIREEACRHASWCAALALG